MRFGRDDRCEAKLTRANYDKIKNGMSLAEVQTLLGGSGTEDSSPAGMTVSGAGIAGTSKASNDKTYVWKENGVEIIVTFAEGKVVQFRQVGL